MDIRGRWEFVRKLGDLTFDLWSSYVCSYLVITWMGAEELRSKQCYYTEKFQF